MWDPHPWKMIAAGGGPAKRYTVGIAREVRKTKSTESQEPRMDNILRGGYD